MKRTYTETQFGMEVIVIEETITESILEIPEVDPQIISDMKARLNGERK